MRQALGPGALGRPRGSGWRGRWEGGSGWEKKKKKKPERVKQNKTKPHSKEQHQTADPEISEKALPPNKSSDRRKKHFNGGVQDMGTKYNICMDAATLMLTEYSNTALYKSWARV